MCTLAIYYKAFADYPVVVAANRDEYLVRPALPPTTLSERPRIIGGKDLIANGTWLGINEYGIVAGLLNRRNADGTNDPSLRSRGLLCLDVLHYDSAAEAARFAARFQHGADYNPFNLLIASRKETFVAYNRSGAIEVVSIKAGLHLLTNLDVDDFECPRISRAYTHFAELGARGDFARNPVAMRAELAHLLADHSTQLDPRTSQSDLLTGPRNSLCLHSGYLRHPLIEHDLHKWTCDGAKIDHFFAAGPPCTASFERALVP